MSTTVDLEAPAKPRYKVLPGASHRLVAVSQNIRLEGVPPGLTKLTLPPQYLPFGLLGSVLVSAPAGGTRGLMYTLDIKKATGQRKSKPHAVGSVTSLLSSGMSVDSDELHEDIAAVRRATKHDLRYRLFAAVGLLCITLEFHGGPAPSQVLISFRGANAVPVALKTTEVDAKLKTQQAVEFLVLLATPGERMRAARTAMPGEAPAGSSADA